MAADAQRWLRDDLTWARQLTAPADPPSRALFLDRDGVIIEDRHYLADPGGVVLIEGAAAAIRRARQAGARIVVVTNQSGIGRGYFGWAEHAAVEDRMLAALAHEGAHIDMVLACGHHPDGRPPYASAHVWRKPAPGMLLEARSALGIALERSMLVGDRASDIAAARAAGLPRAAIVEASAGGGEAAAALGLAGPTFAVVCRRSLAEVVGPDGHWR